MGWATPETTQSIPTSGAAWIWPMPCGSGLTEPGATGLDDGGGTVGGLKLGQDGRDVVGDGLRAQDEVPGDAGIRPAIGDQGQDLALALGEVGERARSRLRVGKSAQDAAGDVRTENGV